MHFDPLKISMVGYLNTLPMRYGLFQNKERYDISLDIPAECFSRFQRGEVDVALVPVGALPLLEDAHVVTDVCIGCMEEVRTVCLFSHVPIERVDTVYLDTDSRTSVLLTKVLMQEYWEKQADYVAKDVNTLTTSEIGESEAVLMIGDKVFSIEHEFNYKYDLGKVWHQFTQLPFVFAVWVSRQTISKGQIAQLNADLNWGIARIDDALTYRKEEDAAFDLKEYFEQHIDYHYDEDKKNALELYLRLAKHFL